MSIALDARAFQIIPRLRYGAVSYPGNVEKIVRFCRRLDTRWIMVFEADDFETNLFPMPFWEQRFDALEKIIAAFHDADISVMLNMQVTFGHGGVANTREACGFRMNTHPDGTTSTSAPCVLDEGFRAWAVEKYRLAARAGFDVIFIDDDFRQANHGRNEGGCFCQTHLDELARRTGARLSAPEVEAVCSTVDRDADQERIFRSWQEIKREGLASLGRDIVSAVHDERADAHMALMIPGIPSAILSNMDLVSLVEACCDKDPIVIRPPDGGYSGYEHEASAFFGAFHSAHVTGMVSPDAVSTPDTDNLTRSRFGKPASSYVLEGLRHVGYGIKIFSPAIMESVPTDWDDDQSFHETFVTERPRLARLAALVERPLWKEPDPYLGIHYPLAMGEHLSNQEISGSWDAYYAAVNAILRLGFYLSPSTRLPAVTLAGAQSVKDDFVQKVLTNPDTSVLLDGEAACEITRMGLEHLIGCRVEPETGHYARELLLDHDANGRYAGSIIQCRNRVERGHIFRVTASEGAAVLSEIRDLDDKRLGDGVALSETGAGRVAVFPFSFQAARAWVLSRRRVQLDRVLTWLAGRKPPVFIQGAGDVVSLVHTFDDYTDLWLYNCGYDPTDANTTVHVRGVHGQSPVARFDGRSDFAPVDEAHLTRREDDEILIRLDGAETLRFMDVAVYRIRRT